MGVEMGRVQFYPMCSLPYGTRYFHNIIVSDNVRYDRKSHFVKCSRQAAASDRGTQMRRSRSLSILLFLLLRTRTFIRENVPLTESMQRFPLRLPTHLKLRVLTSEFTHITLH